MSSNRLWVIANWRPISLINVDVKIASKAIAKRLEAVLPSVIHRNQCAYVKDGTFRQWIQTFYNNISSCVLTNSFSTAPFEIQRGVRQGDPLSSYLFIIVLEILTISIRSNKDAQGIIVDGEEIKLEPFAEDLTAFLINDTSLLTFLELLNSFGECSGLRINQDKSEMMLLGDCAHSSLSHTLFKTIKI